MIFAVPSRAARPRLPGDVDVAPHARLRQQPVFDRQPVHAGEFTRVVRGENQLRVERVARDEHVERPDSVARLLQRVPHLGRAPGFGIAKFQHGKAGVMGRSRSQLSPHRRRHARVRAVALTICQRRGMVGGMSTLAEIEKAIPKLTASELAELEQFLRQARREKTAPAGHSILDIKPSSLGKMIRLPDKREAVSSFLRRWTGAGIATTTDDELHAQRTARLIEKHVK